MCSMKSERRPEEGVEPVEQVPAEVVDRLSELLPDGALDDAVRGLRRRSSAARAGFCPSWRAGLSRRRWRPR